MESLSTGTSTAVSVVAYRFAGTVATILTDEDLIQFAAGLSRLDPTGEAVLGGDQVAELRLIVEHQIGGVPGRLAVEGSLTASADDPYPLLEVSDFDVQPFGLRGAASGVIVPLTELPYCMR